MADLMWKPPVELSGTEDRICKRLKRVGRFFAFLRKHRHRLFDEGFQRELAKMYSDRPRGTPPKPPAFLAAVTLLQAYEQKSDAAAVEEAAFDRRWQMVLDCLGFESPPFSQGVLVDFRRRLIHHELDGRLMERTLELAKETGDFGPANLKVALDSAPLWGAARVEDTFNLIGHAMAVVVDCAAKTWGRRPAQVRRAAKLEVVGEVSPKAALDIDWTDPEQHQTALRRLLEDATRLREWVEKALPSEQEQPPLKEALDLLARVIDQDIEPDPDNGGSRIRDGVANQRRITIRDSDMRHGRKSKSRVINGFKRHIARDMNSGLILSVTARPANEAEYAAMEDLRPEIERHGKVKELHIDRGYLAGAWASELHTAGKKVVSRPWRVPNGGRFTKEDFRFDFENGVVTCPAGAQADLTSKTAAFPREACRACRLRTKCVKAEGEPRRLSLHRLEPLLVELRQAGRTSAGRARLRKRVTVEHGLAHLCRRQGPRARYLGTRKNVFDLRRTAAVENLHRLDYFERRAA